MKKQTALPIVALACCLLLVGCKKRAAFLVVDSQTNEPLVRTLVDHYTLYEFPNENAGEPYLKGSFAVDARGYLELKKPKPDDTYTFRLAGYQDLRVRMTEVGEKAEYLVVGGPKKLEWFALKRLEDEGDDDVPTFIVPLKSN